MIFTALAIAAATTPDVELDYRTQSIAGKVLCSNPNSESMTCSAIAVYTTNEDGEVVETTELLLSPDPLITLTMSVDARIDGATACGTMSLDDLRNAQVRLNGEKIPEDRNKATLERLEASLGQLAGKRACEVIRVENGQLVKYGQVDGIEIQLPGKPVKWVDADDGYRVAAN